MTPTMREAVMEATELLDTDACDSCYKAWTILDAALMTIALPADPAVVELHYPDGTCARWNVSNATGDRVVNMLGTPDTLKC